MTGLHGSLAPLPQDGACRGATGEEPASLSLQSRLARQASDFPPAIARGHSHSDQRLTSCPRTSPPPSAGLPSNLFPSSLHSYIPHPFPAPRFPASPPIPPSVFFLTFQSQRLLLLLLQDFGSLRFAVHLPSWMPCKVGKSEQGKRRVASQSQVRRIIQIRRR